jgi:hypothetical protein
MFHTHISSVCCKCFICLRRMFHSNVSCFREVCSESHGACFGCWGIGCGELGAGGWGMACLGPVDGGVVVLIPTSGSRPHGERGAGSLGRSRRHSNRAGCVCGASEHPSTSHALIFLTLSRINLTSSQVDLSKRPVCIIYDIDNCWLFLLNLEWGVLR